MATNDRINRLMSGKNSYIIKTSQKLWDFHNVQEEIKPCDAIIGLGSYDIEVAKECCRLQQKGMGKIIIFSGNEGNWTKGKYSATEAEAFRDAALEYGARDSDIILEKSAKNIGQNLVFSKKIMDEQGVKTAIVVTKPQTKMRTRLTINKQISLTNLIVHSPNYTMCKFIDKFGADQLINEMVGDIDRIKIYPAEGYQEATIIPEEVLTATEELKSLGFTKHALIPYHKKEISQYGFKLNNRR